MACAICGMETAASIYRCALHRRPAFYSLRIPSEACERRTGATDALGERAEASRPLPREVVLDALLAAGATGATIAELRENLVGYHHGAIHSALQRLAYEGHARLGPLEGQARRWYATPAGRVEADRLHALVVRLRPLLASGWRTAEQLARDLGCARIDASRAAAAAVRAGRAVSDVGGQRVRYRGVG